MSDRKVVGFIRTPDGNESPVFHDEDIEQRLPNRHVVALKGTIVEGTEFPGPDLPVYEEAPPAEE